jgi:hypothetical protein
MHRFLLLIDDVTFIEDELPESISSERLFYTDEPRLRFVKGHHEEFEDNVIEDEDTGLEFFRSTDGFLYYFTDYMTKLEVINEFENS